MYIIINRWSKEAVLCTDMKGIEKVTGYKYYTILYWFKKYHYKETNDFIMCKITNHMKSNRTNTSDFTNLFRRQT